MLSSDKLKLDRMFYIVIVLSTLITIYDVIQKDGLGYILLRFGGAGKATLSHKEGQF